MNATELLAMYERVADAPDAMGQLRSFVLDLAVRGKLVEQDEKAVSSSWGSPSRAPELNPDEFPVPGHWRWTTVGDAADSRLGKMLDKSKNKGTPRRYLRNVNVRWFDFDLSDLAEMRFEDAELPEFERSYLRGWRARTRSCLGCSGSRSVLPEGHSPSSLLGRSRPDILRVVATRKRE